MESMFEIIRKTIRLVPDWPKPGIMFHDITPLLKNPDIFHILIDLFSCHYINKKLDLIVGIDARGFILGSVLAYKLNVGFIPLRKKGKLPFHTISEKYKLEYGTGSMEIHTDAILPSQNVVLIDDLIATGGTMEAAVKLLQRLKANILGIATIIDLQKLGGSEKIKSFGIPLFSLCKF